jgi:hypothetical protein
MRVLRYSDYSRSNEMLDFLIKNLENPIINESLDLSHVKKILKELSSDIKFNFGLVLKFGAGVGAMMPIVENLIKNGNLKIELTQETLALFSIATISILYLENIKNKSGDVEVDCLDCDSGCDKCENGKIKSKVTRSDIRTILEELKMRGIGNGLVKKFVNGFRSISNLISLLFKNSKYSTKGLLDIFGYTALLIPIMNAINALVGKYEMNVDTIIGNFLAIGASVTTLLAKNSMSFLLKRLKDKFSLKEPDIKDVEYDLVDKSKIGGDPINEQ